MSDKAKIFVLTFEYHDKSSWRIVGVTEEYRVAAAWNAASDGQHKVYAVELDSFLNVSNGWAPWPSSVI